jgi:hypothetical protein
MQTARLQTRQNFSRPACVAAFPRSHARPLSCREAPVSVGLQQRYVSQSSKQNVVPQASAAADGSEGFKWGADMKSLGIAVGLGVAMWFAPSPSGVTKEAWHLLSIFVATIVGIITQPLPLGAVAMLGLGAAMVTKTLTFAQAFSAFASEIPYDFQLSIVLLDFQNCRDRSNMWLLCLQMAYCHRLLARRRLYQVRAWKPNRIRHSFAFW